MAASFTTDDTCPAADSRSLLDRAGESPWLFPIVLLATDAVAGRHVLEFRYHSESFAWTWPATLAAWAVAGGVVAGPLVRRATS
jgi:hypothetical protein